VTTLAGAGSSGSSNGIGTDAKFFDPRSIMISPDGDYALIIDSSNDQIRHLVISTASVTTLAGVATTEGSTDGIGTIAKFTLPSGISISSDGTFAVIADFGSSAIRHLVISTAAVTTLAARSTNGVGTSTTFQAAGVSLSPNDQFV
jgi:DNA-binding beta-propeller fold protein YncE